jgi:hypothetical protein
LGAVGAVKGLLKFVLKKAGKLRLKIISEILPFDRDSNHFLFHKRAGTCLLDAVRAVEVRGEGRIKRSGDERSYKRAVSPEVLASATRFSLRNECDSLQHRWPNARFAPRDYAQQTSAPYKSSASYFVRISEVSPGRTLSPNNCEKASSLG